MQEITTTARIIVKVSFLFINKRTSYKIECGEEEEQQQTLSICEENKKYLCLLLAKFNCNCAYNFSLPLNSIIKQRRSLSKDETTLFVSN